MIRIQKKVLPVIVLNSFSHERYLLLDTDVGIIWIQQGDTLVTVDNQDVHWCWSNMAIQCNMMRLTQAMQLYPDSGKAQVDKANVRNEDSLLELTVLEYTLKQRTTQDYY